MIKYLFALILSVFLQLDTSALSANTAQWKQGHIYRDPQLENFLLKILQPLYKAAELNPTLVQPRVIVDSRYNAFATLENLVVTHTGFFIRTKTVEELAGVLAHETGHQAGRHIVRTLSGVLPKAAATMIVGAALGGLLSVATGHPEVGIAGILGAQNIATSQFTAYSRGQERTADDYAIRLLKKLDWPLWGFRDATETMLKLSKDHGSAELPIYLQTHPASIERREYVDQYMVEAHKKAMPDDYQYTFKMAKARVAAFTMSSHEVDSLYPDMTQSDALYAKALVLGTVGNHKKSLEMLTLLIKKHPTDPYLLFSRGEVHQAAGSSEKALGDISAAINLAEKMSVTGRKEVIMRFERATTLVLLKRASEALREMTTIEALDKDLKRSPSVWDQYARIYDLLGDKAMQLYSLAEANLAMKNLNGAKRYLKAAKQIVKAGTTDAVKLSDLELRIGDIDENSFESF